MADSAVISDVSTTLVDTLDAELATFVPAARAELNDLSGPIPLGAVLTITLYEVLEDGHSRNRQRVREPDGPTVVTRKPPMALVLRYLMTPWAGDQLSFQQITGRTLQVLYDDAILDGLQLRGGLLGSEDTPQGHARATDSRRARSRMVRVPEAVPALAQLRDPGRQPRRARPAAGRGRPVPHVGLGLGRGRQMRWRPLPEERTVMYSPAWSRPVDTFTGRLPRPPLGVALHLFHSGTWVTTDQRRA